MHNNEQQQQDVDLEDMTDEDLKVFIEDVISDMVSSGELEAGESFDALKLSPIKLKKC